MSIMKIALIQLNAQDDKVKNIQKGIDVGASVVTLGASIFSKNPNAIALAITGVIDVWGPGVE